MIKKIIKSIFFFLGYEIKKLDKIKLSFDEKNIIDKNLINLNIGSGGINLPNFINLDYSSDWYKDSQTDHNFIEYNIIKDNLPFESKSVSNIYISHVIEHLEDSHVKNLFEECFRVLKSNGTMRIATPDAKFLYEVSKLNSNFWKWRFQRLKKMGYNPEKLHNINFLVRELSTPKLDDSIFQLEKYKKEFNKGFQNFMEFITRENKFNENKAGHHINWWSFNKLETFLKSVEKVKLIPEGKIIESKANGSISQSMKSKYFDTQASFMTVYVEYIKN